MKKLLKHLSVAALCVIAISCSQSKKTRIGFHINGTTSIKTHMAYLINNEQKIVDSAQIANHKFSFKGHIDRPVFYEIGLKNQSQKLAIILENTNYDITIAQKKYIIIGGELQTKYNVYKNQLDDLQEIKMNYIKSHIYTPIKKIRHKIDSLQYLEEVLIEENIAKNLNNDIASQIFKNDLKNNTNKALLSRLITLAKNTTNSTLIELIDTQITLVSVQEIKLAQEAIRKRAAVKTIKRQPAPMFYGESLQGGDLSLKTVLKGQKAVLIDFWASWCGPCRQITPMIKNLHQKYRGQGFTVLTVSEDKTRDAWRNGVVSDGMSEWNHIFDDSMRIAYMFNVGSIPHMVLIDGKGSIVKNKISINDLEHEIQKLIK